MIERRTAKVERDGRLRIPQAKVRADGLGPGDEVDLYDIRLKKQGVTRRAFLSWAVQGTATAVTLAQGGSWLVRKAADRLTKDDRERAAILDALFGPRGSRTVALVPASSHPFARPRSESGFYELESSVCREYARSLLRTTTYREVSGFPEVKPDDHLVLAGSPISNLSARELFGNPWLDEPQMAAGNRHWTADLQWNVWVESEDVHWRKQFGGPWAGYDTVIVDRTGTTRRPEFGSGDVLIEDLLLVTVAPRSGYGEQRIVALGGTHGPGTAAATMLFAGKCERIDALFSEIEPQSHPYFQALFSVSFNLIPGNESVPARLHYEAGAPLDVRFTGVA